MQTSSNSLAGLRQRFGADFGASVVVFLVALPLCMGIAIASGVPPAAGLITGIVGGIVVGFLAGSPLQVSGPAAGLAVIIWDLVQKHGFESLGVIVLVAGLTQVVAGLLGVGRWFQAVPPSVVFGMLAGIGVLIFSSQFHVLVDDSPRASGVQNLISIPEAIWKGVYPLDGSQHNIAALTGLVTIGIMIAWNKFAPERVRFLPAALVAVVTATVMANVFGFSIRYVDVPSNLFESAHIFGMDSLGQLLNPSILGAGLAVAAIASAETLLSAAAVDRMHSGVRTNFNRELAAQGVGNALCGFLGALPMTGVIVRSSANVAAGAKTRASAILHGIWLLVLVAAGTAVLRLVPVASLAAVLVFTGYKLINVQVVSSLRQYGRSEVAIYVATASAIVITDLLTGVAIGIGLALIKFIVALNAMRLHVHTEAGETTIDLGGAVTFLRLPILVSALGEIPRGSRVRVNARGVDYIDHACLEALRDWSKQHSAGGEVEIDWDLLQARTKPPVRRSVVTFTRPEPGDDAPGEESPDESSTDERRSLASLPNA